MHKSAASTTSLIPILGAPRGNSSMLSPTPFGTPHEQISGCAAAIAGGSPELLDPPSLPAA
jgi:hypothetical protein